MRSIKLIGLGLVAVLAMAVSASAASAKEFHYTGSVPTALLGESLGTQTFVAGFGTVKCSTLTAEGEVTKTTAVEQAANIAYNNCEASIGKVKTPINASYTFNANGTVHINSAIKFEIEGVCTITVEGGQTLPGITYGARSINLKVIANVENIKWSGTGLCGSGSKGTYTGESSVMGASGGEMFVE